MPDSFYQFKIDNHKKNSQHFLISRLSQKYLMFKSPPRRAKYCLQNEKMLAMHTVSCKTCKSHLKFCTNYSQSGQCFVQTVQCSVPDSLCTVRCRWCSSTFQGLYFCFEKLCMHIHVYHITIIFCCCSYFVKLGEYQKSANFTITVHVYIDRRQKQTYRYIGIHRQKNRRTDTQVYIGIKHPQIVEMQNII